MSASTIIPIMLPIILTLHDAIYFLLATMLEIDKNCNHSMRAYNMHSGTK